MWNRVRLEVAVTMGCNFECAHCYGYGCPSYMNVKMSPDEVVSILDAYFRRGGGAGVKFTGGEPTLNMSALLAGIDYCTNHGIPSTLATNGWWGKEKTIYHVLQDVANVGVTGIFVTYDLYHAAFNKWENVKRILEYTSECNIPSAVINITRCASSEYKNEVERITNGDTEGLFSRGIAAIAVSNGRAQNVKHTWERLPLVCPFTAAWRQVLPFVSLLPENRICINCVHNEAHIFEYHGNWTDWVDARINERLQLQLKYQAFLTELDKQPHPFVDGCDVCTFIGGKYGQENKYREYGSLLQEVKGYASGIPASGVGI